MTDKITSPAPADPHDAIMRLTTNGMEHRDWCNTREAYLYGHRDARHAAAELVAAAATTAPAPAVLPEQVAMPRDVAKIVFGNLGKLYVSDDAAPAFTAPDLCETLQQWCSDRDLYWRAPDAHGVCLTIEQATELLGIALGVEVEIKTEAPVAEHAEPACWVDDLTKPQPHCVTNLRYRSAADVDAGKPYSPLYTAPQSPQQADHFPDAGKMVAGSKPDQETAEHIPTIEDIDAQDWQGMDGATAWHLIDRHGEGWDHIGRLMAAWLDANRGQGMGHTAGSRAVQARHEGLDAPDLIERMAAKMKADADAERARKAALSAAGTCPECEGEGQQGGQFCGGYWTCEACGGTGKSDPQVTNIAGDHHG